QGPRYAAYNASIADLGQRDWYVSSWDGPNGCSRCPSNCLVSWPESRHVPEFARCRTPCTCVKHQEYETPPCPCAYSLPAASVLEKAHSICSQPLRASPRGSTQPLCAQATANATR